MLSSRFRATMVVQRSIAAGITGPGPTRYGGSRPHSEPESRAILNFIQSYRPRTLFAFHAQGEEIFYDYMDKAPPGALILAELLSELSGYRLVSPEGTASHGGLKDYFISAYGRPGFTIEVGRGQNPLPIEDLGPIYARLLRMMMVSVMI